MCNELSHKKGSHQTPLHILCIFVIILKDMEESAAADQLVKPSEDQGPVDGTVSFLVPITGLSSEGGKWLIGMATTKLLCPFAQKIASTYYYQFYE